MSRADVLDQARLDLLPQAAAAPGLEQVGHVALLEQGRQLGLERLVLVDLDVDRDVRVRRRVLVGEVLPQAEARIVVLDVVPGDGHGLAGGLRRRGLVAARSPTVRSSPPPTARGRRHRRPNRRRARTPRSRPGRRSALGTSSSVVAPQQSLISDGCAAAGGWPGTSGWPVAQDSPRSSGRAPPLDRKLRKRARLFRLGHSTAAPIAASTPSRAPHEYRRCNVVAKLSEPNARLRE